MRHYTLDRRTLMRAAATFGCVALSGVGTAAAGVPTVAAASPLTGALIGWLVIQPDGAGRLSLVETDHQSGSVRLVAADVIGPASSLEIAARQATTAAVEFVAESWGVQPSDCSCPWGRIEHLPSKQSIPFQIWTDFA